MQSTIQEINGFRRLRLGILILLLSLIISISSNPIMQIPAYSPPTIVTFDHVIGVISQTYKPLIGFIISLLTAITSTLGTTVLKSSFNTLRINVGNIGALIYLLGSSLTIITYLLLITFINFASIIYDTFYVCMGLLTIGQIMIGIAIHKIGLTYRKQLASIGGIIVALSSVLSTPFILIGYTISYLSLKKKETEIRQIGQGTIDRNGKTYIALYSETYCSIVSAFLEQKQAKLVNPITLKPGTNTITIEFDPSDSLNPKQTYNITLVINKGDTTITTRINVRCKE